MARTMSLAAFRALPATVAQDMAIGGHEETAPYVGGDLGDSRRVWVRAGSVDALSRRDAEERQANRGTARRVRDVPA